MSELGNLSTCVMDGDRGTRERARRLRRKALAGSLFLQAAIVGGMLLWPLLSPAVLTMQAAVTPIPPYRAERPSATQVQQSGRPTPVSAFTPILLHPIVDYQRSAAPGGPGEEPPTFGDGQLGPGQGPLIPGAANNGRPIELPAPIAAPKKPVRVSAGVMAALLVHRVQPEYPKIAVAAGISGTVELEAQIGTDGEVEELRLVSGNPILAQAALEAVRQWRYQPTRLNGEPVEVETRITVTFTLDSPR
ncbi:MAG TPA: energy transducer TonB [Candidatus Aquilonibacter sp.]|nr:energy transducer TonB [Candidatus Aquilonibacter sp.]